MSNDDSNEAMARFFFYYILDFFKINKSSRTFSRTSPSLYFYLTNWRSSIVSRCLLSQKVSTWGPRVWYIFFVLKVEILNKIFFSISIFLSFRSLSFYVVIRIKEILVVLRDEC